MFINSTVAPTLAVMVSTSPSLNVAYVYVVVRGTPFHEPVPFSIMPAAGNYPGLGMARLQQALMSKKKTLLSWTATFG